MCWQGFSPEAIYRQVVSGLDTTSLAVLYLDIPLTNPAAARAIRIAEERGFFWAALLPDARVDGDVLRLQRLARVAIATEHIETVSDHGESMVQFVLAECKRAEGIMDARASAGS